ncbi:MAG: ferrous iron transport protein A [Actinobacteria bacterium HGW-Actinobacteria-10]|jgi:Fe2+ transport system protein FeoA|nr:MAG: ferrous iron transport protein A [Actinobacteria bacterium HGW-Actinobacteria-10]
MPSLDTTDTSAEKLTTCDVCSLDCIRKGELIEIVSVDDSHARVQALRFGMAEGACVKCVTRIPAGPLVIQSGRQEIAVGRALAKRINVRRLSS